VLAPAVRKNGFVYIFFCEYPQYSLENTIKEQKNQEKPMRAEALLRSFEESRARRWRYSCRKTVFRFL
jgi:hypothetical protein